MSEIREEKLMEKNGCKDLMSEERCIQLAMEFKCMHIDDDVQQKKKCVRSVKLHYKNK